MQQSPNRSLRTRMRLKKKQRAFTGPFQNMPEMRTNKGVLITNPISGYELWVSGNIDYVVLEYEDVDYNKDCLMESNAPGYLHLARGHLFLVEAKRQDQGLAAFIPEAVSQAIALLRSEKLPEVRFCLSDGRTWMFFVLKMEDNDLIYFESPPLHLSKDELVHSDLELWKILQLVCESSVTVFSLMSDEIFQLRPTVSDLFELEA